MGEKVTLLSVLKESLPVRLLIPYMSTAILFVVHEMWVLPVPFLLFAIFNKSIIKELIHTSRRLLNNPNMLDVDGV